MIYNIIEVTATVADAIFLIWFISNFFHEKFYAKKNQKALIFPLLVLIFQLIADYCFSGFDMIAIAAITVLSLAYALFMCNHMWAKAILATSLFVIVEMFTGSILFVVFGNFIEDPSEALQGAASFTRIIYLAIAKLSQFVIYKLILLFFKKSNSLDKKNGAALLFFSFLTIIGLGALMIISVYGETKPINTPILIILTVLIISNFAVYGFIRQIMDIQTKEYEYNLLKTRMDFEQMRTEDATAIWDNIRKVRHDLKNHFTIIKGMIEQGESASCIEYIEKIHHQVENMGDLVHTDNTIINYLINTKMRSDKDINVIVSGYADIFNDIDDVDLASLIGNILDNASEAISKLDDAMDKQIELHFLFKNQNRIILCKNTIADSILENNKELRSTKSGSNHGLGNKIVDSVAKKYGGFVAYSESNNMFCVQIILPMKSEYKI